MNISLLQNLITMTIQTIIDGKSHSRKNVLFSLSFFLSCCVYLSSLKYKGNKLLRMTNEFSNVTVQKNAQLYEDSQDTRKITKVSDILSLLRILNQLRAISVIFGC